MSSDVDNYHAEMRRNRVACAPLSVWYCLGRFGKNKTVADVIARAELADDGMSLSALLTLSRDVGLFASAIVVDKFDLPSLTCPAVLILDDRHCVVFEGLVNDTEVRVFEPTTRTVGFAPIGWVQEHWTGEAIVFAPPAHGSSLPIGFLAFASSFLAVSGLRFYRHGFWQMRPSISCPSM